MTITDFVRSIAGFSQKNHPEKIKRFGWFLHTYRNKDRFGAADMRACYAEAHLEPPSNMTRFLQSLTEKTVPDLLRDGGGYRLAHAVREKLDAELGAMPTAIVVEKMLTDLPGKISDVSERIFLVETLSCYRVRAFRAAIVMAWNLAYDHVARWVLADARRLAEFNTRMTKCYPKKTHVTIADREDFEELTEREAVEVVGGLTDFPPGTKKVLVAKLDRRNTYAHPSLLVAERAQVDDMITDLVNNVILRLPL